MKFFHFFILCFSLFLFSCQEKKIGDPNTFSSEEEKQMIDYIKLESNYKREFGNDFEKVKSKYQKRTNGISVGVALKKGKYATLLNLTYSKKNNVYTKEVLNIQDFEYYVTYSTTKFENLFKTVDANSPKFIPKNLFDNLENKLDFNDIIESEINPQNIVLRYFDEDSRIADIENEKFKLPVDYIYQTYIEKTDNGFVAFNKEEIIGTYKTLNELFEDNKINPLPLRILTQLKFGNSPEKSLTSKTGPWIDLKNDSSIGLLTKKSEVFYKIEIWNGLEKKGKPELSLDNGVLKKDSKNMDVYIFDTVNSIVSLTDYGLSGDGSYLNIQSKEKDSNNKYQSYHTQHLNGSETAFDSSCQLSDNELFYFESSIPDEIKKEFPYLKNPKISFNNSRFSFIANITGTNDTKQETHKLEVIKSNNNYVKKITKFIKTPNEKIIKKGSNSINNLF